MESPWPTANLWFGVAAPHEPAAAVLDALSATVGAELRRRPDLAVAAWGVGVPEASAQVRERVRAVAADAGLSAAFVRGRLAESGPGLLISDVDSTMITGEVIDLLAEHAGTGAEVAAVTEQAMRGELDFGQSLAARVKTLEGLPVSVLDEVADAVELSPGADDLVRAVHAGGGAVALVSGGFAEIVTTIAQRLGVGLVAANRLEVVDGRLTGRTRGAIVDRGAKARWLAEYRDRVGARSVVAVGDGANDLDMLDAADLGVAYCAKPVTARAADAAVPFPRLDAVAAFWPPFDNEAGENEPGENGTGENEPGENGST